MRISRNELVFVVMDERMRRIPLRIIASHAGVSVSTVSRALNDDPRISEETKSAVRRSLAMLTDGEPGAQRPSTIGVFLAGIDEDRFFAHVLRGATLCANQNSVSILVERITENVETLPFAVTRRRVDGAIIGGVYLSEESVERFVAGGVPTVVIGRFLSHERTKEIYAVLSDNVTGGSIGARHLIACGYDHIVAVPARKMGNHFRDRIEGIKREVAAPGVKVTFESVSADDVVKTARLKYLRGLVESGKRVGLFCLEDDIAIGIMPVLKASGFDVPGEVGVMGYNCLEAGAHISPALSTINVPKDTLGYLAARLLLDVCSGVIQRPVQITVQPRLEARESTSSR